MKPTHSAFSEEEILTIRQAWDAGATARELGQAYGRAAETMARIGRRETWAHIPEGGKRAVVQASPEAEASLARLQAALEAERSGK